MNTIENPPALAYRWYAVALAHLGREAEAKAAAQEYLRRNPTFSIAEHLKTEHFSRPEDLEHYAEGLRKAGFS